MGLTVRNGDFSATVPIEVVAEGCPTGYLETSGVLRFEAEDFDESIPNSAGTKWTIVPDERLGNPYLNDSGGCNEDGMARHIQSLPDSTVELEGIRVIDEFDAEVMVVGIRTVQGRDSLLLAGSAVVTESPETSAVLAVLDATNRWLQSRT